MHGAEFQHAVWCGALRDSQRSVYVDLTGCCQPFSHTEKVSQGHADHVLPKCQAVKQDAVPAGRIICRCSSHMGTALA